MYRRQQEHAKQKPDEELMPFGINHNLFTPKSVINRNKYNFKMLLKEIDHEI
jgi:hypothetical protein